MAILTRREQELQDEYQQPIEQIVAAAFEDPIGVEHAAGSLGVSRATLYQWKRKHGLTRQVRIVRQEVA